MNESRQAAKRLRDARDAMDDYAFRVDDEYAAGGSVIPGDENDPGWAMVTEEFWQARANAPWWAQLRYR